MGRVSFVLFFAAAAVSTAAGQSVCQKVICGSVGSACGVQNATLITTCSFNRNFLLTCNAPEPMRSAPSTNLTVRNVCTPYYRTLGESCNLATECVDGTYCGSGVCTVNPTEGNPCGISRGRNVCSSSPVRLICYNEKCRKPFGEGDRCDTNEDCSDGLYCTNLGKVCAAGNAGDECSMPKECAGAMACVRVNNSFRICTASALAKNRESCLEKKCETGLQCDFNEKTCYYPQSRASGRSCVSDAECIDGYQCNANRCSLWKNTLSEGEECGGEKGRLVRSKRRLPDPTVIDCDPIALFSCEEGLVCNSTGYCAKAVVRNIGKACTDDQDCGTGGMCACDMSTGVSKCVPIPIGTADLWNKFVPLLHSIFDGYGNEEDFIRFCIEAHPLARTSCVSEYFYPNQASSAIQLSVVTVVLHFDPSYLSEAADVSQLIVDIALAIGVQTGHISLAVKGNSDVSVSISGATKSEALHSADNLVNIIRRGESTGILLRKVQNAEVVLDTANPSVVSVAPSVRFAATAAVAMAMVLFQ